MTSRDVVVTEGKLVNQYFRKGAAFRSVGRPNNATKRNA